MASHLSRSPTKPLIFTMNSFLTGRNHELYGIARGVIVDSAHIVFQVFVRSRANIHAWRIATNSSRSLTISIRSFSEILAVFDLLLINRSKSCFLYPFSFSIVRARLFLYSCKPLLIILSNKVSGSVCSLRLLLRLAESWI